MPCSSSITHLTNQVYIKAFQLHYFSSSLFVTFISLLRLRITERDMAPAPADYYPEPTVANLRSDSKESSRQRRHRRTVMRRTLRSGSSSSNQVQQLSSEAEALPSVVVNHNDETVARSEKEKEKEVVLSEVPRMVGFSVMNNPMPTFGAMSIQGLSSSMEDAWFVAKDVCRPDVIDGQPLHFFAVYDGHGGPHVSSLCKQVMHLIIAKELMGVGASIPGQRSQQELGKTQWENLVRTSLLGSFQRVDQMAISWSISGRHAYTCGCHPLQLACQGSTANVALLTPNHIVVANCGDSRAVLCRNGMLKPLSLEQKIDRPDERERIYAAGGRLVYDQNGEFRAQGVLNISRSIGDPMLKSVISSQPEVSITKRESGDEFLILATAGFWDVISNDLACAVAKTCLGNESFVATPRSCLSGPPSIFEDINDLSFSSRTHLAAALLCRLALARGSSDNITVIVVDFKRKRGSK